MLYSNVGSFPFTLAVGADILARVKNWRAAQCLGFLKLLSLIKPSRFDRPRFAKLYKRGKRWARERQRQRGVAVGQGQKYWSVPLDLPTRGVDYIVGPKRRYEA